MIHSSLPSPGWRTARSAGLRLAAWVGLAAVAWLACGTSLRPILEWARPRAAVPQPTRTPTAAEMEISSVPEWPHLRGPHYDGHSDETDLADAWPPEGPPVLWSQELGSGYSALVAVGDRVYTQRQTLARQSVVCLDADTGTLLWEHDCGWPYEPGGMYPGPRATPTYCDGLVVFAAPDGLVGCLRADDGRRVWAVNVRKTFRGRGTDFGYACSPLVEDGKVVLPVGGPEASVVALDLYDGSTVWASGSVPASYGSALPITFRGRRMVVAFLQNSLAGFDLATGRLLWEQRYSTGYDEHAAMPLYDEPYLMAMGPFRGGSSLYRLEPDPEDRAETDIPLVRATLVRQSKQMSNDVASSVLLGGHVYGFDITEAQTSRHHPSRGQFKCMEFLKGTIRWATDRVGHATVLAADGKLFLLNDRGELILARTNPERYEELARAAVFPGEICWTAPTLCRGRLYLRSPTRAVCLYVGKPGRLTPEQLARARPVSAIPTARIADVTWLVGGEREHPYDAPDLRELTRWYVASLVGVLLPAALVAGVVGVLVRLRWPAAARPAGWTAFWVATSVLGVAATPLGNRLWADFVFTWPAALFAAQQIALAAILSTRRRRGSWWLSDAAVALLLSVSLAYYDVCRRVTLAVNWAFLMGFLPSMPLAIPAARSLLRGRRPWVVLLWTLAAFSLYFWSSAGFILGKAWLMRPGR